MSHTHPEQIDRLSLDCVILGLEAGQLNILLIQRGIEPHRGEWALPGGFVLLEEGIDEASRRILREMTGVDNLFLEQVRAFGAVDRYPGRRVITLVYYALVRPGNYQLIAGPEALEARWFSSRHLPPLPFDHNVIVQETLALLQYKVRHQPVGFELLPEKFTLFQLQELYEAILGQRLDKPNFRRKLMRMNLLVQLDEYQQEVAHRAARLYRFDKDRYDDLCREGFVFEVGYPKGVKPLR
ncbi:MAG: NUDIX domain-containing protein [Bacteroidia bacterium]|nr:NUDIX domain-containing protein [Bacteroidia bacterium]